MEVTRVRRLVDELANTALLLDAAAWMPATPRRPADGDPQRHGSRPEPRRGPPAPAAAVQRGLLPVRRRPRLTDLRSSLGGVRRGSVRSAAPAETPRRRGRLPRPPHPRGHSADRTTPARRLPSYSSRSGIKASRGAVADDWFADQRALVKTRRCPTLDLSALRPGSSCFWPKERCGCDTRQPRRSRPDERESAAATFVIRTR